MTDDAHLQVLAERFGTPTYVYDLDAVAERVAALRAALPEAELRYAVKANPNGALLRRLASLGVGAEVITLGELERAHRAGFDGPRLLVGGPGQTPELVARGSQLGAGLVSLDSEAAARAWQAGAAGGAGFLVRLNPGFDPGTHAHLATGAQGAKFGLPPARAHALAERLQADGALAGFHVHAGSMLADAAVHAEVLRRLAPLLDAFPEARTLNLGGGFAAPDFPLEALADVVRPVLRARGLHLVLEPGRWLVAEAGVLLTRVLARKPDPPGHWIADAGMADLLRPALYEAVHPIRALGRTGAPASPEDGDVDGPLCENADRLGRARRLQAAPGDLLAVERAGAYGFAMASNYASSLRPAEVVLEGGSARLARRRERPEDLWRDET